MVPHHDPPARAGRRERTADGRLHHPRVTRTSGVVLMKAKSAIGVRTAYCGAGKFQWGMVPVA